MVTIFVPADEVTMVIMEMKNTLDVCEAEVIGDKIGMDEVHTNIIRSGYKPPWLYKALWQRVAHNLTIST